MPLTLTRSFIYLLVVLAYLLLAACIPESINMSTQVADQLKKDRRVVSHQLLSSSSSLHYMASCDISPLSRTELNCEQHSEVKRILVFIHGTPGNWSIFSPQLADEKWGRDTLLLALDRPGWGQSVLDTERVETSLVRQAHSIAPLLQQLRRQFIEAKVYLVGHSLGATLAPLVAIEFPGEVDGVIAIAGDLRTEAFSLRWYNYLADLPIIRAIIPRDMCFANEEVMALEENLKRMEVSWHKLHAPLLVLQGGNDELVSPKNAELVKGEPPPGGLSVVVYPELGHLMHLEQKEEIDSQMRKWIQKQERRFIAEQTIKRDSVDVSPSDIDTL